MRSIADITPVDIEKEQIEYNAVNIVNSPIVEGVIIAENQPNLLIAINQGSESFVE